MGSSVSYTGRSKWGKCFGVLAPKTCKCRGLCQEGYSFWKICQIKNSQNFLIRSVGVQLTTITTDAVDQIGCLWKLGNCWSKKLVQKVCSWAEKAKYRQEWRIWRSNFKHRQRGSERKTVGHQNISIQVQKCLGKVVAQKKGAVHDCGDYRQITLLSHTMKLWKREVEGRVRSEVSICVQKYSFMPRKTTIDAYFAMRMLLEKYREGQRLLYVCGSRQSLWKDRDRRAKW